MVEFKGMIRGFAWRLFDSGHPEYFTVRKCNATQKNSTASDFCKSLNKNDAEIDPGSISYEFSHFMGLVLWFLYQFLLVMILMNILIAMMTTTFTRISETANIQWRYTKSFYQVEFLHSKTILPAPLRIFYQFANLIRYVALPDSEKEKEKKRDEAAQKKYTDTMLKLLDLKILDFDRNVQTDMMKDMQNLIREEIKTFQLKKND